METCPYPFAVMWPQNGMPPSLIETPTEEYETDWVKGPGHLKPRDPEVARRGFKPGNYCNSCADCQTEFVGAKGSSQCFPCSGVEQPKTGPYARSYVRSLDGAVMVEIDSLGFVSEEWACFWNYITPGQRYIHAAQAKEVRTEARQERKARKATWKQHGVRRAQRLAEAQTV